MGHVLPCVRISTMFRPRLVAVSRKIAVCHVTTIITAHVLACKTHDLAHTARVLLQSNAHVMMFTGHVSFNAHVMTFTGHILSNAHVCRSIHHVFFLSF